MDKRSISRAGELKMTTRTVALLLSSAVSVAFSMAALGELTNKDLVRNLLWPVCIAGCMATGEHEPCWRDLLSNVSRDRWSFSYPSKVLTIMEECWRLRKCKPETGVDWRTAMESLNIRVLLV